MNAEITIALATNADAADMANINARSWEVAYDGIIPAETIRETSERRPAQWQKWLSAENSVNHIIRQDGAAVGFVGAGEPRDEELDDSFFEIHGLYLHPDYFGKGCGRAALEFAEELAMSRGKSHIVLWVLKDNARARHFYEKCGYSFDGTEKEIVIGKPLVEIRYAKELGADK